MDKWEEYAADFKNEAEVEEELQEDGANLEEAEIEHFEGD